MHKIKLGITLLAFVSTLLPFDKGDFKISKNAQLPANGDEVSCQIEYVNVAFANGPYLLYAVKVENTDKIPSMYVWTTGDGVYDLQDATQLNIYQDNVLIGGEYFTTFIYDEISAKQISDYIYAKAFVDGKSSEVLRYSVLEYAQNVFENKEENDSLVVMLKEILQYGETAQKHFNYHTDRLPSDDYYLLSTENCLLEDGFSSGMFTKNESIILRSLDGSSLNWYVYQNGNYYSALCESDTLVLNGIDADTLVTTKEYPVKFTFSSFGTLLKNGNPCGENYCCFAEDSSYTLTDSTLTIGSDVYTYRQISDLLNQKITISEISSSPLVFNVALEITPIGKLYDGVSSLKSKLTNRGKLMFYVQYMRLTSYVKDFDLSDENVNEYISLVYYVETEMAKEIAIYSVYVARFNELVSYINNNFTQYKNYKKYFDEAELIRIDTQDKLHYAESLEKADIILDIMRDKLLLINENIQIYIETKLEYESKARAFYDDCEQRIIANKNESERTSLIGQIQTKLNTFIYYIENTAQSAEEVVNKYKEFKDDVEMFLLRNRLG